MLPEAEFDPQGFDRIKDIKVTEIGEHEPRGPGDLWFYEVRLDTGQVIRIFNMTRVVLTPPLNIVPVEQRIIT